MIVRVFDFWPFSMEPGVGFLFVFLLLSVLLLGGAHLLGAIVGGSRAPTRSAGERGSSTSAGLAVGQLPRETDALVIALLRGGKGALVETLLGTAIARGWLAERDGKPVLVADAKPKDPHERALLEEIARHRLEVDDVLGAARSVADRVAPELEARLESAGLWRTVTARVAVAAIPLAATVTLWLFAFARVAVRAAHFGDAPFPTYLSVALVCVTAAGVMLAWRTPRITPLGRKYLTFVEGASTALRDNVRVRRSTDPTELPLTIAVDGIRAVSWMPFAIPIAAVTAPIVAASAGAMGVSSAGASACSSSSCASGGSSCGGSSCGGGGGCS